MSAAERELPPLIPRSARFEYGAGDFLLDAATTIVLGPEAGDETIFAARQLQAAVRDVVGLELPLRRAHDPAGGRNRVALPGAELLHDYLFTARQIAFAAEKTLLGRRIRQTPRSLADGEDDGDRADGLARLDAAIAELALVRDTAPALAAEFEARWLRHARRSEIG